MQFRPRARPRRRRAALSDITTEYEYENDDEDDARRKYNFVLVLEERCYQTYFRKKLPSMTTRMTTKTIIRKQSLITRKESKQ